VFFEHLQSKLVGRDKHKGTEGTENWIPKDFDDPCLLVKNWIGIFWGIDPRILPGIHGVWSESRQSP